MAFLAGLQIRGALGPLDGFLKRFRLNDNEAGDEFLRFGEWAIDHFDFAVAGKMQMDIPESRVAKSGIAPG